MWLILILLTFVFDEIGFCQVNGSSSHSDLPVPARAKWRFEPTGKAVPNGFYRLACSPDGRLIAARNRVNVVEVRDSRSRELVCELAKHKLHIKWMEFSPDSKHLVTASTVDEPVMIWHVQSGKLIETIDCHPSFVTFSQTGKAIIILEADRVLEYGWPGCQFKRHRPVRIDSENKPVVSRNGRYLVVAQRVNNQRVHLTKLLDLDNDSSVVLPGPPKPPKRVVFSNDNVWAAATYSFEPRIRLWNLGNPSDWNYSLAGHDQTVESIAFSSDNRFLVTTGKDKKAVLWDLLTREPISELRGHGEFVISAAFSPTGSELVTGASGLSDSTAIVWDLDKLLFPQQARKILKKDFAIAWRNLGSSMPASALRCVNDLQFSADEVFEQLKLEVGNPVVNSEQEIYSWIEQLNAATFKEREAATEKLKAVRGKVEQILLEVLDDPPSTEVHYRINQILQYSAKRPKINVAELRRLHRAVMLLELISRQPTHRDASVELLQVMSQSHPHLDVSRDAASALTRIIFREKLESEF